MRYERVKQFPFGPVAALVARKSLKLYRNHRSNGDPYEY